MAPELSLETLATKLDDVHKTANLVKTAMDEEHDKKEGMHDDDEHKGMDEEHEKKAMHDEEEKSARKARYNAMKKAMDEPDEEKRDAAFKTAMDEHEHEEKKEAMDEEHKEQEANVASIIGDKKAEFISKILSANKIFNPLKIKEIEARVKKANLTALKKEWAVIEPFIANMPKAEAVAEPQEQFIPFYASMGATEDIDKAQLNANSPDSAFAQLSTKELLEMTK